MKSRFSTGIGIAYFCLAACSQKAETEKPSADFSYKISEDGAPETKNKTELSSINEKMFTKVQKYKIVLKGKGRSLFII